jgi:hypothetical protein
MDDATAPGSARRTARTDSTRTSSRETRRSSSAGQSNTARIFRRRAPDVVARNRRLVARFDGISLALCHALRHEHVHEGVPTADGETTLTVTPVDGDASEYVIDPWPFNEEEVTVVYDGRRLEGVFTDQEAMRTALRGAPWVTLTTHLRSAEARLTDARARLRARPRRQASLAGIRSPEVDAGLAEDVLE